MLPHGTGCVLTCLRHAPAAGIATTLAVSFPPCHNPGVHRRTYHRYRRHHARKRRQPGFLDRLLALARFAMLVGIASAILGALQGTGRESPARALDRTASVSPHAALRPGAVRTACDAASSISPVIASLLGPLICGEQAARNPATTWKLPASTQQGQHRVHQAPPPRGWTVQKDPRQPWVAEPR